jgi:hypothetical protein
MTGRPRLETADELEQRRAYITPRRARAIRLELEQDHELGPAPAGRLEPGSCGMCGRRAGAPCPLPARRCPARAMAAAG